MNKIKTNQLQIIKLNNKTYIPFQLHQLPKYYSKSLNQFNLKKFKETLVFHKTYSSKNHR